VNTLNLDYAKKQLESMIGAEVGTLDPDSIDAVLHGLQWGEIPEEIDTDAKMTAFLGLSSIEAGTDLVVVTDASFEVGSGAFAITVAELASLYTYHLAHFGERVFSGGDVIIWTLAANKLWIIHHEGVFTSKNLSVATPAH